MFGYSRFCVLSLSHTVQCCCVSCVVGNSMV